MQEHQNCDPLRFAKTHTAAVAVSLKLRPSHEIAEDSADATSFAPQTGQGYSDNDDRYRRQGKRRERGYHQGDHRTRKKLFFEKRNVNTERRKKLRELIERHATTKGAEDGS